MRKSLETTSLVSLQPKFNPQVTLINMTHLINMIEKPIKTALKGTLYA